MADNAAAQAAIDRANRDFERLFNAGDIAGAARRVYHENALVMPPDAPSVRGAAAIAQFWQDAATALGLKTVLLATKDLMIHGDCAHEVGEAVLGLESGSATAKYVVVWHKDGAGEWRWFIDIWNMNPDG